MKEILFFTSSIRKRLLFRAGSDIILKNFVLIEIFKKFLMNEIYLKHNLRYEEIIVRSVYNLRRILLKGNIINSYLNKIFFFYF